MTLSTRPPRTAAGTSPAVRTARAFLTVQVALAAWLWGIVAAVWVVLTVVAARSGGVERSTWELVEQGPRWFQFAMALIMVIGYLPTHVANGMTRRSFTAALGAVMAVTAVGYAALWTLGFAVERVVFSTQGWPADQQSEHLVGPDGSPLLLGLESLTVFAVYAASGALVGATYYRGGAWWGTLTLPLTVGPVLLAEVLASGGGRASGPLDALGVDGVPVAGGFALLVVLVAALATAAHLVLRDVPIRAGTA
jgi:hypothetical protein